MHAWRKSRGESPNSTCCCKVANVHVIREASGTMVGTRTKTVAGSDGQSVRCTVHATSLRRGMPSVDRTSIYNIRYTAVSSPTNTMRTTAARLRVVGVAACCCRVRVSPGSPWSTTGLQHPLQVGLTTGTPEDRSVTG